MISIKVYYECEGNILCFYHAVEAAIKNKHSIETCVDIDESHDNDGYDSCFGMHFVECVKCNESTK